MPRLAGLPRCLRFAILSGDPFVDSFAQYVKGKGASAEDLVVERAKTEPLLQFVLGILTEFQYLQLAVL